MSGEKKNNLLLSFYGDDFTGSADAMEALSLDGVRTALFLAPPSVEQLQGRFTGLQVVGVAGISRTMTPAQMSETLPEIFGKIKQLGAPLFHYKTCSTFDSSPTVGSIGRAIEIGQEIFGSRFVPLVVGAPALDRYCLFGNLFANFGDTIFRLDRHPTMRAHPVTPMHESDLRVHLSHQTKKRVALFDILQLTGTRAEIDERLSILLEAKPDVVLFDVLDEAKLAEVGRLIWDARGAGASFVAGSSGVEYALASHWRKASALPEDRKSMVSPGAVEQLLVVSGSCSPVTQNQIEWALAHGFAGLELDAARLVDADQAAAERATVTKQAVDILATGRSLILHTALGPDDQRISATAKQLGAQGIDPGVMRERLGEQLGTVLLALLEKTRVRRVVVAGGDTSGYATRQLGIYALELLTPIAPGSPLCRASSQATALDGLEIALKGGQGGKADYFDRVRGGAA